jgi:multiple sugar transport system ATP-binding protein
MTMGDRICVMKDGVIQQIDGPLSLYDKPKNRFVAGFIGSPPMNFVDVDVVNKGGDIYLNEGKFEIKVPAQFKNNAQSYVGQKLVLGIRPEDMYDISTYTLGPKNGNVFKTTVDVVEPLGSEIFLHLNTGKNILVAKVDSHNQSKPSQEIEVAVNLDRMHLFELQNGQAII